MLLNFEQQDKKKINLYYWQNIGNKGDQKFFLE